MQKIDRALKIVPATAHRTRDNSFLFGITFLQPFLSRRKRPLKLKKRERPRSLVKSSLSLNHYFTVFLFILPVPEVLSYTLPLKQRDRLYQSVLKYRYIHTSDQQDSDTVSEALLPKSCLRQHPSVPDSDAV